MCSLLPVSSISGLPARPVRSYLFGLAGLTRLGGLPPVDLVSPDPAAELICQPASGGAGAGRITHSCYVLSAPYLEGLGGKQTPPTPKKPSPQAFLPPGTYLSDSVRLNWRQSEARKNLSKSLSTRSFMSEKGADKFLRVGGRERGQKKN